MQIAQSRKPFNKVDYYSLPNGHADVFLRKNRRAETDEEGNSIHVADEVYFQIIQTVTKEQIESDFEYFWQDAEKTLAEPPTQEERLKALESAMLEMILGGA